MKYLIVYGTNEGQTARIAARIAQMLEVLGNAVDVVDGRHIPPGLAADRYTGVIVAGSVHAGRFQPEIRDFVSTYHDCLRKVPSAFVAVSLAEAFQDANRREQATSQIDRFLSETGWRPDRVISVAGAIRRSRLSWVMRRITYRTLGDGVQTETADHEYTDWEALARSVGEFIAIANPRPLVISVPAHTARLAVSAAP